MGKIIMCGSFKGGVGKFVTTYNLAYSLAEIGKKVLAAGSNSQENLSTCFGIEDVEALPVSIRHLIMAQMDEEELPDASEYIHSRNSVDFIPSSMVLSAVDSKLRLEINIITVDEYDVTIQSHDRWQMNGRKTVKREYL